VKVMGCLTVGDEVGEPSLRGADELAVRRHSPCGASAWTLSVVTEGKQGCRRKGREEE
jgi:hypothetical protein